MNILGIDPGTGRTGWGIIKRTATKSEKIATLDDINLEYIAHGCITTEQEDAMPKRLLILHDGIDKLIKQFKPDCIVVEQIFFGRNTKTAIAVGQARGVIILSAAKNNLSAFEYTSIAVKYFLSGHGRTEKKDVQEIVRKMLNKNAQNLSFNAKDKGFDDAADALAIAIHHALKSCSITLNHTNSKTVKKAKTNKANNTKKAK